ncbi:MAG: FeS cluster assembly scaffold protein NifU [Microgenomates bacterium 39_7]|nr:MAG: FeS cluster assembly scaffold protein NifU [Microgenomates bacterium 39_7]
MSYSQQVIEHFYQPHNQGQIEDADGVGEVGNLSCGDVMKIYIKVAKNEQGNEVIENVKFETFGCVAAIATSSMITDLAKGQELSKAMEIKNEDVMDELGDLPQPKIHCSVLAADALAEAIYDYLFKTKQDIPPKLQKRHEYIVRVQTAFEEI